MALREMVKAAESREAGVSNMAALRSIPSGYQQDNTIILKGYTTPGDGGGGVFRGDTTAALSFTGTSGSATITCTGHTYLTGQSVRLYGTLPSPLSTSTTYYVTNVVASTSFQLATSANFAIASTPTVVTLTATGTGTVNTADDNGTSIIPFSNPSGFRWRRIYDGPINVKWFGAIGDGVTDSTIPIQNALDYAVAIGDGPVYFPPGDYGITSPLIPRNYTGMNGSHSPNYSSVDNPRSACKILTLPTFSGAAMWTCPNDAKGIAVRGLAFVGPGMNAGSTVHCFQLGDWANVAGEQNISLRDVTIQGFSGDGITGHMWVWVLENTYIIRCRWAINPGSGNAWYDGFATDCIFTFCKNGCVQFTGTRAAGAVTFTACRFERSGNTPGSPLSPLNTDAPGLRINAGNNLQFIGCQTDANTGNGFEIERLVAQGSGGPVLANISITGCEINRDGGGDQSTLPEKAGIMCKGLATVEGANYIMISGCFIATGKHDDSGAGTSVVPKYGVILDEVAHIHIVASRIAGTTKNYQFLNNTWKYSIFDREHKLMQVPEDTTANRPTEGITAGMHMFDTTLGIPIWYNGSVWKNASGTTV